MSLIVLKIRKVMYGFRQVFLMIVMVFTGVVGGCHEGGPVQSLVTQPLQVVDLGGNTHSFIVEMAVSKQEQQIGLMNRTALARDRGMLFLFPDSRQRSFWMKETLIPLDLLFISEGGVVHHIHENARPHDLSALRSYGDSRAVLEINGGLSEELGIAPGSRVVHSAFPVQLDLQEPKL